MANISAANITYTIQEGTKNYAGGGNRFQAVFAIAFGNGTLTYPNSGIGLNVSALGCPESLEEFHIMDANNGDGFLYKYNYTNSTIRIYQGASHSHSMLVVGGQTSITTNSLQYVVSGAFLGMQLASTVTIGAAVGTTAGGILATTVGANTELTSANTVSATTLYAKIVGW